MNTSCCTRPSVQTGLFQTRGAVCQATLCERESYCMYSDLFSFLPNVSSASGRNQAFTVTPYQVDTQNAKKKRRVIVLHTTQSIANITKQQQQKVNN